MCLRIIYFKKYIFHLSNSRSDSKLASFFDLNDSFAFYEHLKFSLQFQQIVKVFILILFSTESKYWKQMLQSVVRYKILVSSPTVAILIILKVSLKLALQVSNFVIMLPQIEVGAENRLIYSNYVIPSATELSKASNQWIYDGSTYKLQYIAKCTLHYVSILLCKYTGNYTYTKYIYHVVVIDSRINLTTSGLGLPSLASFGIKPISNCTLLVELTTVYLKRAKIKNFKFK